MDKRQRNQLEEAENVVRRRKQPKTVNVPVECADGSETTYPLTVFRMPDSQWIYRTDENANNGLYVRAQSKTQVLSEVNAWFAQHIRCDTCQSKWIKADSDLASCEACHSLSERVSCKGINPWTGQPCGNVRGANDDFCYSCLYHWTHIKCKACGFVVNIYDNGRGNHQCSKSSR